MAAIRPRRRPQPRGRSRFPWRRRPSRNRLPNRRPPTRRKWPCFREFP